MTTDKIPALIELANLTFDKIKSLENKVQKLDSIEPLRGIRGEKGDRGFQGDLGPIGPMPNYRIEKNFLQFQKSDGEWGELIDLRKLRKGGGTFVLSVDSDGVLVSNRVDEINFESAIVTTNTDPRGYRKVNVSLGSGFVPPLPIGQTYIGNNLNQPIATPCEQWVLLDSITAVNTAQIDINLDPPYEEFKIELRKLIPMNNNGNFIMFWSADGGANYLSSGYRNVTQSSSPGSNLTFSSFDDTLNEITILEGCGKGIGESVMSDVLFYNPLDSTLFTICKLDSSYVTDNVDAHTIQGTATNTTIDPINSVRFSFSNGGIQSGLIRVYGKIN